MAEIVLSQAGAVAGSALLPNGLTVLGANLSGQVIGETLGRLAGRAIDASLVAPTEGPRLKSLHVTESREGVGLPLVYGRMRIGGQVIWAARFKEKRRERAAGKGGPKYADYTYSVSFAVALSQGPITRIDRIWANGELINLSDINWRLYTGHEAQLPDPLIEAIEGVSNAPAYRGTAYIVFEDLPLDAFGNRLPQLSFEVVRAGQEQPDSLSKTVTGVNIIPASGEFVYATSIVRERRFPGIERALNMNNAQGAADFVVSVDQLKSDLPRVADAALTVAWFGTDLRAGECEIKPGVETRERDTVPYGWTVDGTGRGSAHLISNTGGDANYGGTPADTAVLEGIALLKQQGIAVTLSPFLLMDVANGNDLPDPYGAAEQAPFPWRGRLTVSADRTAQARTEIQSFVGQDGGFGFRHFILHHARLAVRAGGVDAFLIGSEMVGLTRVRDDQGQHPFVEALIEIAAEARLILGPDVSISYAADWTEYGAYMPINSNNDVLFPLDPLWASPSIDFVGVDWYPPAGDWREGEEHLDFLAGYSSADEMAYLSANMAGGEAYDWYYASAEDRAAQMRTPIVDTAHGEDWIFRQKDLVGWWQSEHYKRPAGVRETQPTGWLPGSKPVRLIEIGFPAVDRGGNAPNLFFDPKSSESAFPPFSTGQRNDLFQRRALAAALSFWNDQPLMEQELVWAWDGRPWPDFPSRQTVWSDGPNWQFGHWLNGRSGLIELSEIVSDIGKQAGLDFDVSDLTGVIEGFGFDGVSTLSNALSPLKAAFGFVVLEQEGQLVFETQRYDALIDLSGCDVVEASASSERILLDKQPGAVAITYISGDGSYEPATAEARHGSGDRDFTLRFSFPLVMNDAHAQTLAQNQLDLVLAVDSATISLGPSELGLEVSDLVQHGNGKMKRVQRIVDNGFKRDLLLGPQLERVLENQSVEPGQAANIAAPSANPLMTLVDGPNLGTDTTKGPYIALAADPWPGNVSVYSGADLSSISERSIISAPSAIGRLVANLESGPLGRWDRAAKIEVYMPGSDLSSFGELSVLSGRNMMLIEHTDGWELIAWRYADLIATDTWRLSGLLRGLKGTTVSSFSSGSIVILADERLTKLAASSEEIGLPQIWRAGQSAPVEWTYDDRGSRPLSVGHLRANRTEGRWEVTWSRRSLRIPQSWSLPEAMRHGQFKVELFKDDVILDTLETTEPELSVTDDSVDRIHISQIGADGRAGPWASILLAHA